MEFFNYKATTKNGDNVKGMILAKDKTTMLENLQKKGIYVTRSSKTSSLAIKFSKAKDSEIALMLEILSGLMKAGVDIIPAIDHMIGEQKNIKLSIFLFNLKKNIEDGNSLYDSIKKTNFFNEDINQTIKVGVESGKTVDVLLKLADYFKNNEIIKNSIIKAVVVPIVVIIIIFLVITFAAPALIEPMRAFYEKINTVKFPVFSDLVISFVDTVNNTLPITLPIFFGTFGTVIYFYKNNYNFKLKIDTLFLKTPLVGEFIKKLATYKFIMSIQLLYNAGVNIETALKMIATSQSNEAIKNEFNYYRNELSKGFGLSQTIKNSRIFPDIVKNLISTGEATGSLGKQFLSLENVTKDSFYRYSDSLTKKVKTASSLLVMLCIAAVIFAVYLPILGVMDIAKNLG